MTDRTAPAKEAAVEGEDAEIRAIISALKGSANWHAEQGRPYSEQVDLDAIAMIERLQSRRVSAVPKRASACGITTSTLRR